ncbi:hypothetical protein BBD42_02465 [Paenibacillus sp. BIHB 4019]|uniref:IDEAL domain-containing protein n=1 Tax=Paenibacillus sp. BIHB 4019 TaxID=1870819 RepID=A0A1B2DS17_9BACL|nr:IDEAL domain-containing protein [Paenibacillus sp. BIHB 4019]ANY70513.1 hypothetical protein BBD42_02465 [Paenibacillus sp. BIHB 4019]
MNNEMIIKPGDWMNGTTGNGELMLGFVESVDASHGTVRLYVTACDNELAIGRTITLAASQVNSLRSSPLYTVQQLTQLIDLALATNDEAWFNELSGMLITLNNGKLPQDSSLPSAHAKIFNRLGISVNGEANGL